MTTKEIERLSVAEFDALMTAVHAHSKAQMAAVAVGRKPLPGYPLPEYVLAGARRDACQDYVNSQISEVLQSCSQDPNVSQTQTNSRNVGSAIQGYQGEMSFTDFKNALNNQRIDNQVAFDNSQDNLFQQLSDIARLHPCARSTATSLLQQIGDFLPNTIWRGVADFFDDLESDFDNFCNEVESTFEKAANDIESFFARIF